MKIAFFTAGHVVAALLTGTALAAAPAAQTQDIEQRLQTLEQYVEDISRTINSAESRNSSLLIEGTVALQPTERGFATYIAFYDVEQTALSPAPGFYTIEIAMACLRYDDDVWGSMNTILEMAQPGDRSLKPIPPDLFGIRE
jgi:hypothetical protein